MLTRLLMMCGGTNKVRRLSWVVGAIHRIIQGCYGANAIVLSVLELKLEMEVSGWRTGMIGTAIAKVEQSMKMNEDPTHQRVTVIESGVGW